MIMRLSEIPLTHTDRELIDTIKYVITTFLINNNPYDIKEPLRSHLWSKIERWVGIYRNIREVGIKNPILLNPESQSVYNVIKGHTRIACAELCGINEVEALYPNDDKFKYYEFKNE